MPMMRPAAALLAAVSVLCAAEARGGDRASRVRDFEAFWKDVEQHCRLLETKGVDWKAVRRRYLPLVARARDDAAFLALLRDVVGRLRDGHAHLKPLRGSAPARPEERFPGVVLAPAQGGRVAVLEVQAGATGEARRLRPGLVVTRIDGKPAAALLKARTREAWERGGCFSSLRRARYVAYRLALRGEPGTAVTLEAGPPDPRGGSPRRTARFRLRRDRPLAYGRMYVPPEGLRRDGDVYSTVLPGGTGFLYLRRLDTGRNAFDKALAAALDRLGGCPALVVDLRGNAGGYVPRSFAGLFDRSKAGPGSWNKPLAVLVDAGTFSAGEGAASFFRERTDARLFGRTTAGSSSKKRTFTAPSGLFSVYYSWRGQTNYGRRITEFHGIEPHETVEISARDLYEGRDSFLEAALRWLALSRK